MSTRTFDPYDHEGEDAELAALREREDGSVPQSPAQIMAAVDDDVELYLAGNPHADADAVRERFTKMAKNRILDDAHRAAHEDD